MPTPVAHRPTPSPVLVALAAVTALVTLAAATIATRHGADAHGSSLPRVLVVGDSVAATLTIPVAAAPLRAVARPTVQGWQCRRTTKPNTCGGASVSTLAELQRWRGQAGRAIVVISGYNDAYDSAATFGSRVDTVMLEVGRHNPGVPVVWLTLANGTGQFGGHNQALWSAARRWPALKVADWAGHSAGRGGWFVDGIHLTASGAKALGTFVAQSVSRVLTGRSIPAAAASPGSSASTTGSGSTGSGSTASSAGTGGLPATTLLLGSRGASVRAVQAYLVAAGYRPGPVDGIYGLQTASAVHRLQLDLRRRGLLSRYAQGAWDRGTRDAARRVTG